ncbi:hypothetical protein BASA61_008924 [Batrachochytrium salamandrivorans]|nr:hypothetical protein BASA61_008924 [Batrachochytrium salamandrivorans]
MKFRETISADSKCHPLLISTRQVQKILRSPALSTGQAIGASLLSLARCGGLWDYPRALKAGLLHPTATNPDQLGSPSLCILCHAHLDCKPMAHLVVDCTHPTVFLLVSTHSCCRQSTTRVCKFLIAHCTPPPPLPPPLPHQLAPVSQQHPETAAHIQLAPRPYGIVWILILPSTTTSTLLGPLLSLLPSSPSSPSDFSNFFIFQFSPDTRFEPPISVAHSEIPRQAQDTVEENPTASRTTTTDTHTAAISSTPTPTHISHIGSDDILTVLLGGSLPGTNTAGNTEACPGQQWLTAKSPVTHTNVPPQSSVSDPCFWISSLSSLNKLLLPGTLNFGSAIHADTFFIDCGADDVFMDAELATRLNIPLVKIPVPIKLRLADGDSSSMITHRTLPLQLHIGRHVETIGFYVTSLCHGIILGYSWLERHNPQVNWESRMVDFGSSYCLDNCCVGSTRIQGLGKPPSTSDISPKPSIPEPEPFDQTSDSVIDPDIDLSLFKDPSMDLDLGIKNQYLKFPAILPNQSHLPKRCKPKFIRFWKHHRFQKLLFLRRSTRNFQVYFPSLKPIYCRYIAVLTARSTFIFCRAIIWKNLPVDSRRRQGNARMDLRELSKRIYSQQLFSLWRTLLFR